MQPLYLKCIKTPIFMQMETGDCGAAALGIILSYYGCELSLSILRSACLASRDGVSVANIIKAAKQYGMDAIAQQQGLSSELKLPAILFWNRKHYVVLEGFKRNKIYINDPKHGRQVIDNETFKRQFSGIIIQLKPNALFIKQKKPKAWRMHLWPLFKAQRKSLTYLSLGIIILSLLNLSPLLFTKLFIDQMVSAHETYSRRMLLLALAISFMLQFIISYGSRTLFRQLETQFAMKLSKQLIHSMLRLPLSFFAHRRAGELIYRLQLPDRLASASWSTFCSLVIALIQGIASFGFLLLYSPVLTLIALSGMFIYFLGTTYYQKSARHLIFTAKSKLSELSTFTASGINMIMQLKAQCLEPSYFEKWQERLQNYLAIHRRISYKHQLSQIISIVTFSIGYCSFLAMGIYFVYRSYLTIGELMACQILFLSFHEAVTQRGKFGQQLQQLEAEAQGISDMTDYSYEPIMPRALSQQEGGRGKIEMVNVTFGYSKEFKPLFNRFNLTIEPETKVAIVGPSGSGKSTLIHLLSGLYQPWSGDILIDGIPLYEYTPQERAHLIGVVGQQQFFYQGTIRENMCLWDDVYSDKEIIAALRIACIDELVTQTLEGLDYPLLEGGSNLSGGQRQRLEIARTLLSKPRILLLDEATSSLDPIVEQRIKRNLQQYSLTKVVIAHRHNTIQDADIIYVINNGELIDKGSKKQLVTKKSDAFTTLF